ncbi:MAG: hypothetical protein JWO72_2163 [Caulobacteraceae bacterium]|jgi:hypothetical protein|nr:hypothetical protein [Caulobacteraceae bacterium]
MSDTTERAPLRVRLAWFFAIALGSALATAAVAEGLRLLILH